MNGLTKGWLRAICVGALVTSLTATMTPSRADGPEEGKDNEPPSTVPYLLGLAYAFRGEHEKAVDSFTKAVELEPDFDEAIFACGDSYVALGQYERALSDYAEVIRLMPHYGRAYYHRALVYLKQRQHEAALADLLVAVERMRVVPEPYLTLGDLYFARSEPSKALVMYKRYLELAGTKAEAYVLVRVGFLVASKP